MARGASLRFYSKACRDQPLAESAPGINSVMFALTEAAQPSAHRLTNLTLSDRLLSANMHESLTDLKGQRCRLPQQSVVERVQDNSYLLNTPLVQHQPGTLFTSVTQHYFKLTLFVQSQIVTKASQVP